MKTFRNSKWFAQAHFCFSVLTSREYSQRTRHSFELCNQDYVDLFFGILSSVVIVVIVVTFVFYLCCRSTLHRFTFDKQIVLMTLKDQLPL